MVRHCQRGVGRECMVYGFILCGLCGLLLTFSLISLISLKVFLQTHIRANAAWSRLETLAVALLAAAAVASVAYFLKR